MSFQVGITQTLGAFSLDVNISGGDGVTALFGHSGAGKTTIARAIAGLARPQSARIVVGDRVLEDTQTKVRLPPHRRRIGYVFQDSRLFPHLTVARNLDFGAWFARGQAGTSDRATVIELLGLGPLLRRWPGTLSGGERQRVAIGRALLSKPALLLLDEPLASLDHARKAEILPYLERLRDQPKLPMLYISHSVAEIARLSSRVVVLANGRVIQQGAAAAVLADPAVAPSLGVRDAGAVITAQVTQRDAGDGLSRLDSGIGPLLLPQVQQPVGATVRVRVNASEVLIARSRPEGLSALNVLPTTITAIRAGEGPGAIISLKAGSEHLLARVTRRSVRELDLAPGVPCFAILKALAIAPEDVGGGASPVS